MSHDKKDKPEGLESPDPPKDGRPVLREGILMDFSLDPINADLICPLCQGYFRDPYTVVKCLHTFCRSCLFFAIGKSYFKCPTCNEFMGQDVLKVALPDRILQNLVDKVLFPEIAKEDTATEIAFYEYLEIPRKEDGWNPQTNSNGESARRKRTRSKGATQPVVFQLVPYNVHTPGLENPFIETDGVIRIGQIKKYLATKLGTYEPWEIYCDDVLLGNEISVNFALRTIWMQHEPMRLTYRARKALNLLG